MLRTDGRRASTALVSFCLSTGVHVYIEWQCKSTSICIILVHWSLVSLCLLTVLVATSEWSCHVSYINSMLQWRLLKNRRRQTMLISRRKIKYIYINNTIHQCLLTQDIKLISKEWIYEGIYTRVLQLCATLAVHGAKKSLLLSLLNCNNNCSTGF